MKNLNLLAIVILLGFISCTKDDIILSTQNSTKIKNIKSTSRIGGVLIGNYDLDGDGITEKLESVGTELVVTKSTGVEKVFYVGNVNWRTISVSDFDGIAGSEIALNLVVEIKIINYKKDIMNTYSVSPWVWSVLGVADLDGIAGNEIALKTGSSVKIIFPRSGAINDYLVSTSNWSLLGIENFDGIAGSEIIISMGENIKTITPRNGYTWTYSLATYWSGYIVSGLIIGGIVDFDGVLGNEIAIYSIAKGDGKNAIQILYPKTGGVTTTLLIDSNWVPLTGGITDLDGIAGNEIALHNSLYTISIVCPRNQSVVNTPTKDPLGNLLPWVLLPGGVTDLDGLAGSEIAIGTKDNVKILTLKSTSSTSYVITDTYNVNPGYQGSWSFCPNGIGNFDGFAGSEIKTTNSLGGTISVIQRLKKVKNNSASCTF